MRGIGKMENPEISIIIPIYNAENYIEKCIISIKDQTYKNFECILVDDGSQDDSKKRIVTLIQSDKRFKYIYKQNGGPSSARNIGMKIAVGHCLIFVDADDYIRTDYLEKLLKTVKASNDLGICGYTDVSKYGIAALNDFRGDIISKQKLAECVIEGTGGVLWGKIFITDIIKNNHIMFDENLFMSEDMIFILEYLKYVKKWMVIDEPLYFYNRLNENGISRNIDYTYLENYKKLNSQLEAKLLDLNIALMRIELLIDKRMCQFIYQLIVSVVRSSRSLKDKKEKIKIILDDPYLKPYISKLETNIKAEKIGCFFIKERKIMFALFYISAIEKFKDIKRYLHENRNINVSLC